MARLHKYRCDLLGKEPQAMRRGVPGHGTKPEVENQAAHTNVLDFCQLLAHRCRGAIDQAVLQRIPGSWRPGTHGPLLAWGLLMFSSATVGSTRLATL